MKEMERIISYIYATAPQNTNPFSKQNGVQWFLMLQISIQPISYGAWPWTSQTMVRIVSIQPTGYAAWPWTSQAMVRMWHGVTFEPLQNKRLSSLFLPMRAIERTLSLHLCHCYPKWKRNIISSLEQWYNIDIGIRKPSLISSPCVQLSRLQVFHVLNYPLFCQNNLQYIVALQPLLADWIICNTLSWIMKTSGPAKDHKCLEYYMLCTKCNIWILISQALTYPILKACNLIDCDDKKSVSN